MSDWSTTLKNESCHYANFVLTGGTVATSDDKVGIMTTLGFQWMISYMTPLEAEQNAPIIFFIFVTQRVKI